MKIMKPFLLLLLVLCIWSCQSDDVITPDDQVQYPEIPDKDPEPETIERLYLLNEGNMNMNKASLDYLDLSSGEYHRNFFSQANPDLVGGLGDVGNDMGIYGSKLYVVVNASNKVEILDVKTGERLQKIDINNCRYITFFKGKAYLSSYLGTTGDPNAPNGTVSEIDTTSLSITRTVEVGRQPEELVAYKDRIYVANSGGYSPPDYESTISVIDIESFTKIDEIEVAINLHRLKLDSQGELYVSSRGDYFETPPKLFVVNPESGEIKKTFDIGISDLVIHQDIAYIFSTEFSYITGSNEVFYRMLDTRTESLLDQTYLNESVQSQIEMPYGIAIHPDTEELFITDAKDYVTPGSLFCISPDGSLKWEVTTGDIPAHLVFYKN